MPLWVAAPNKPYQWYAQYRMETVMLELLIKQLMANDENLSEEDAKKKAQEMIDKEKGSGESEAKIKELEDKLSAAEGKAAGILADKKKLQEKVSEIESKIEEMSSKDLSAEELSKKATAKLQDELIAEKEKSKELETKLSNLDKQHKLDEIALSYHFSKDLPEGSKGVFIERSFGSIDLDDGKAVKLHKEIFEKEYAAFLVADVKEGSGESNKSKPGDNGKGDDDVKRISGTSDVDRQKELRQRR